MASVRHLYRYRKLIRSSWRITDSCCCDWLRGRSSTRGYGWYADGYTHQDFGVPVAGDAADLEYYVHPEWLRQRGQVTMQFATARGPLARKNETTPGWKRVQLALPSGHGPLLHVSADSAWSARVLSSMRARSRSCPRVKAPPRHAETRIVRIRRDRTRGMVLLIPRNEFQKSYAVLRDSNNRKTSETP